jgi:hypothetical protein
MTSHSLLTFSFRLQEPALKVLSVMFNHLAIDVDELLDWQGNRSPRTPPPRQPSTGSPPWMPRRAGSSTDAVLPGFEGQPPPPPVPLPQLPPFPLLPAVAPPLPPALAPVLAPLPPAFQLEEGEDTEEEVEHGAVYMVWSSSEEEHQQAETEDGDGTQRPAGERARALTPEPLGGRSYRFWYFLTTGQHSAQASDNLQWLIDTGRAAALHCFEFNGRILGHIVFREPRTLSSFRALGSLLALRGATWVPGWQRNYCSNLTMMRYKYLRRPWFLCIDTHFPAYIDDALYEDWEDAQRFQLEERMAALVNNEQQAAEVDDERLSQATTLPWYGETDQNVETAREEDGWDLESWRTPEPDSLEQEILALMERSDDLAELSAEELRAWSEEIRMASEDLLSNLNWP